MGTTDDHEKLQPVPQLCFGRVEKDGTVLDGSGNFTVQRIADGQYMVEFAAGLFSDPPICIGQSQSRGMTDFNYHGANTRDNTKVVYANANAVKFATGDQFGQLSDWRFAFIAIGGVGS